MKLNAKHISQTLKHFDGEALPDDHPTSEDFRRRYGRHTFFLDKTGLHIVEPSAPDDLDPEDFNRGDEEGDVEAVHIVKLAGWADESRTRLEPHERRFTGVVVLLRAA